MATRRRMRRDEGQALPLLAGVLALVGTLLIGLVALGNLVGERSRAQTAADAAALAGADVESHFHELQLADIIAAIRDGRPPAVDGQAGKATVELMAAIYRAADGP